MGAEKLLASLPLCCDWTSGCAFAAWQAIGQQEMNLWMFRIMIQMVTGRINMNMVMTVKH